MKQVNIAVFVSGGGTNLQALIDSEKNGVLKSGKIKLVVSSQPGAYALERAANAGIPSVVVNKKAAGTSEAFEAQLERNLKEHDIDLIILAGFLSILSGNFTAKYRDRILNVHPSLIPSFCGDGFYGLKVHQAALDYGVKVTGATAHLVNEITDGGRILLQKAVYIEDGDTPEILQKRVMEQAEWIILPQAVELVCADMV